MQEFKAGTRFASSFLGTLKFHLSDVRSKFAPESLGLFVLVVLRDSALLCYYSDLAGQVCIAIARSSR